MTREEAKQKVIEATSKSPDMFMLIDSIYNDFESRTCENCKHYIDEKGTSLQFCDAITDGGIIGWNAYGKDFGCNKFEAKDNK